MDTNKDPNIELAEAAQQFSDDESARIDRIADASLLAHQTVRLVDEAVGWLALAITVFGKYAAEYRAMKSRPVADDQAGQ